MLNRVWARGSGWAGACGPGETFEVPANVSGVPVKSQRISTSKGNLEVPREMRHDIV